MYEAIISIVAFLLMLWAGSLHFQLKRTEDEVQELEKQNAELNHLIRRMKEPT